ncbi:protein FRIGIDA-ESSENTIAL 1 isoform X2 [Daucus carota subsp. sativus]|uniref:protein FRIGIDA-ESSENTIAL 1 isoform X2 n=1 Tax=Daucus carota subsp. sativus TaxID=79200 RepID=UPI0007F04195|nr:PREDICTED: protein FRIGIDA-ESSENTIAL 1-like isoform X2 [Daucus carota subsp. sativus]
MPSPVSNHRPAAIDNQSESDHQSLADDEEYEEIEVEEETEVEEDETDDNDEDEEEEDDFGEVLSPINQDQTRDASPDNVILEHEDQSHPVLLTQENAVNVKSTDMHEVEGDKGVHSSVQMDVSERRGSSSLHVNFLCSELGKDVVATGDHKYIEPNPHSRSRTYKDDVEQKNTALPNGNGILTAQTIESARSAGAESSAAVSMKDNLGGKTTALYYSEEKKKQSLQNEDFKLNETRLEIPTLKPSSLSPGVEFKAGTDKPAIICDFFAQGWCIKGKSCRFLHVSNKTTQQHSGAEADASHKTERRTSEGSDCSSKKPRLATSPDEVAPAVSRSLDRLLSHELGQSLKWKNESEEASPYKDNSSSAGREYLRGENWYLNNHGKHGSEELAATRSQFTLDERMPPLRRSWEANFNSGKLPPTHVPSWTKSSLPFGSTWNLDPLKSHKCLDVEREYGASRSASLQKTPSPFSGSESNNPSRMPVSGDSQHPAGYKTEVPSFRWEVSAPFRPSFDLTKRLLSSVYQYDPIRDSIEQSNLADVYSRFSGAGQESIVSGYNVGEQSFGRNQNILDSNLNKINYGKDLFSAETGTPLSAITEMQNKVAAPKEEKLLESLYIQDIKKRNTPNTENDEYATQTDSSRQKLKSGDMAGRISEMEVGVKVSEDIAKETKALKHFRAALIEFVKELVKPTWREGNLSKDAHKTIVKRAVDKVLSTIPAHQIPFTSEAVDLYLSSSQSKISKLVEGYIDKYGKI